MIKVFWKKIFKSSQETFINPIDNLLLNTNDTYFKFKSTFWNQWATDFQITGKLPAASHKS